MVLFKQIEWYTPGCRSFLLSLLLLTALPACKKENPLPQTAEWVDLEFKVGVPASRQQIQTYSITTADENAIKSIILLAFKVVSPGVETFQYHKEGMQIYPGSTVNEKKFFTRLKKSPDTFRFVLLINGGDQISDIVETLTLNEPKSDVMEVLTYSITEKWDASSSATFSPLPMWGESTEVAGVQAQTILPQVQLLRSLARVDIKLDPSIAATRTITDIYVQNANDQASMAPFPTSFDGFGSLISPSIPAGTGQLAVQHYDFSGDNLTSIESELYLFEAEAASSPGASDATALAIGISENSGPAQYYRIDFLSSGVPIPLLRNRKYSINIININTPGELDPLDVFSVGGFGPGMPGRDRITGKGIQETELRLSIRVTPEE
jgi:hypothetical protein